MLPRLLEYAERRAPGAEPGFKAKWVRWALVFDGQGRFLHPLDLRSGEKGSKGQLFNRCPDLSQPEMVGSRSRHFLVDSAEKVVRLSNEPDSPKVLREHESFVSLLEGASTVLPELRQIAATLRDKTSREAIAVALSEKKAKPNDSVTIAVADRSPRHLVEDDAWHDWWRQRRLELVGKSSSPRKEESPSGKASRRKAQADVPRQRMRCIASGQLVEPAATHPKVSGLYDVGGLPTGDALISFDKESLRSYGLEQSLNAAVGEAEAARYRAALDTLLRESGHRLAGAKVVHWFSKDPGLDPNDLLSEGFSQEEVDATIAQAEPEAMRHARELLTAIQKGQRPDLGECRYFMLTLSGNSGRVVVRDWDEGQFETLLANVLAWFDDLAIVHREGGRRANPPKFWAVLGGLVRDLKEIPGPVSASLWRVAVHRLAIPHALMAQALNRARLAVIQDEVPNHARMGLLRAYHARKGDSAMTPELNEDHPAPAYHCGRLMAVLADLQYRALGDVGAGVVQRYYAAASSTPALVLGRLVRTAQFHLGKLEGGLAHWYEQRLVAIWARIKDSIPRTLTLEEQSLFALGYYHQKAAPKASAKAQTENTKEVTNS